MRKAFFLSLAALFLFPSLTFAGGGTASMESFPLKPFDTTRTYIVAVNIASPDCTGITSDFTFQDTIPGDEIKPFTPPSDGTYIQRHQWNTETKQWEPLCTQYVSVKSGEKKQRTITASRNLEGGSISMDEKLAFGDDQYSKELQGYDRYNFKPQIDVISEKLLDGNKREVQVQWNKVEGASKYAVFARESINNGEKVGDYLPPLAQTTDTKATITVAADKDFYISAQICNSQLCSVQLEPYEVLLSKTQGEGMTTMVPSASITPLITPSTNGNNEKMDALNKKISDLENKLDTSNKKQNILEEKLNQLLGFIKSLFPGFH